MAKSIELPPLSENEISANSDIPEVNNNEDKPFKPKLQHVLSKVGIFDNLNYAKSYDLRKLETVDAVEANDFDQVMMKSATQHVKWSFQDTSVVLLTFILGFVLLMQQIYEYNFHQILGVIIMIECTYAVWSTLWMFGQASNLHTIVVLSRRIPGWLKIPVPYKVSRFEEKSISSLSEIMAIPGI